MIACKQISVRSDAHESAGLGQVDQSQRASGLEFGERVFSQGGGCHDAGTGGRRKGFYKRAESIPRGVQNFIGIIRRIKAVQSGTPKKEGSPVQSVRPKHLVAEFEEWQAFAI
jgi:hypothetical protein